MNNIATHLLATLGRLAQAVAAYMAGQVRAPELVWIGAQAFTAIPQPNQPKPIKPETWTLLTLRLVRLAQRLRTLFARCESNTLPARHPSRAKRPQTRAPQPRLPTRKGWIGAHLQAAAPCAGTIEHLLHNTQEMRGFVTAAPQAGRLLRPLAHMLGLTLPDYLRLPKPPPMLPTPRLREEPERAPPHQGTPDHPLQPEIRAAARAWKKYDR